MEKQDVKIPTTEETNQIKKPDEFYQDLLMEQREQM